MAQGDLVCVFKFWGQKKSTLYAYDFRDKTRFRKKAGWSNVYSIAVSVKIVISTTEIFEVLSEYYFARRFHFNDDNIIYLYLTEHRHFQKSCSDFFVRKLKECYKEVPRFLGKSN